MKTTDTVPAVIQQLQEIIDLEHERISLFRDAHKRRLFERELNDLRVQTRELESALTRDAKSTDVFLARKRFNEKITRYQYLLVPQIK